MVGAEVGVEDPEGRLLKGKLIRTSLVNLIRKVATPREREALSARQNEVPCLLLNISNQGVICHEESSAGDYHVTP